MSVHEADYLMRQIRCDDPITRIIISDDEVMTVNPDSAWEVDRIYGFMRKEIENAERETVD